MYGIIEHRWGEHDASTRLIAATTDRTLRDHWMSAEYRLDWTKRGNEERPSYERVPAIIVEITFLDWVEDEPYKFLIREGFIPIARNKYMVVEPIAPESVGDLIAATKDAIHHALSSNLEAVEYVRMFGRLYKGAELVMEYENRG